MKPFINDEKVLGKWEVFNCIDYKKKDLFNARKSKRNNLLFAKALFVANGKLIQEYYNNNLIKNNGLKNIS